MGRPPCCDKSNVKRGIWTAAEDAKLLAYISKHGVGNWTLVPKKAGLNRCGKSCRLRWTNYLRPDLIHDSFTPQEEEHIINLHEAIGSRWSLIAKLLPGRTDNDVKNYWNTKLKKKLSKMGIDPVTHKPFSQILSDYGNISSLPSIDNQFGSFFKNLNNTFVPKSEPSSGITGLPLGVNTYSNMMMNPIGSDNSTASTLSLGIVAQFQEINQDSVQVQPHFLNEVASSCSSSSSPHATDHQLSSQPTYLCQQSHHEAQITPSSSFNWSEFLLHEPFSSADKLKQEQDFHGTMMSSSSALPTLAGGSEHNLKATTQACDFGSSAINIGGQRNNNLAHDQASSSSMTSFVDTILGQDSEMQAAFPELLDASFDY
ncbi:hypothetical protein L3X38_020336 [Prunus dulcis]|uniref:Uncharacterized protein n=1 Tax=Prunus dulcis TaxID=3755 RepID=A0AAD4ZBW4_PRUDU|nr:hypothetical protein L3X38_020336 [Prunus dulcis]